ncbi:MAG TPA: hypothetical protein VIR38_06910 [Thalassobaculum sp.]
MTLAEAGGPMPAALRDRPEPYADLLPVLQAFALLSAVRPVAAGSSGLLPSAIPLAEIGAYCALFDVGDVDEFVRLIRAMDDAVLARNAETCSTETRSPEPRSTGRHQPPATTGDRT